MHHPSTVSESSKYHITLVSVTISLLQLSPKHCINKKKISLESWIQYHPSIPITTITKTLIVSITRKRSYPWNLELNSTLILSSSCIYGSICGRRLLQSYQEIDNQSDRSPSIYHFLNWSVYQMRGEQVIWLQKQGSIVHGSFLWGLSNLQVTCPSSV